MEKTRREKVRREAKGRSRGRGAEKRRDNIGKEKEKRKFSVK